LILEITQDQYKNTHKKYT